MAKATGEPRKRTRKAAATSVVSAPVAVAPRGAFFKPGRLVLAAGATLSVLCLPLLIRTLPRLDLRPEYRVSADHITLSSSPRWVPPDLIEQVIESSGFTGDESLQDPQLSERIAAAFHTHPWIERVVSVRKAFPARVQVEVVYREPVAMVRGVDGHYPIDRHSVLLPARDFSDADLERYPIIERVASVPLGKLGEAWGDPAVAGAAALAAELCDEPTDGSSWWSKLELSSILVPRRVILDSDPDELEFTLRTRGGSEILWGHRPGSRFPGELPVSDKLQRLADLQRDYGSLDDQHGPYQIDIRPWQGVGRTAIAREPGRTRRQ